jgi:hypothetical protein
LTDYELQVRFNTIPTTGNHSQLNTRTERRGTPGSRSVMPLSTPIQAFYRLQGLVERARVCITLFLLWLGSFLVALDVTIIGVAMPAVTTTFRSTNDIGWYGALYLITLTSFQPLYGQLFTHFDVKKLYLGSIILFEGET